ncbi:MAG: DUF5668 domain-containing protein [Bacteroidales bacterium]
MKKGEIFWGVLLLTLGVLFTLRNFDIFFFNWHSIFKLWPFIFIFWGISLLPVKAFMKLTLSVVAIFFAVLILVNHPGSKNNWWWPDNFSYKYDRDYDDDEDHEEYSWDDQNFSEPPDENISTARLNLNAAVGNFIVENETTELFEFKSEGNAGPFEVLTSQGNSTATIDINQKNLTYNRGKIHNDAWLYLNSGPVWKLNVDVGAANLEMDLSPFKVEKIELDGGASKVELKLGDLYNHTRVTIDAGASAIEIKVPFASACELRTSTILSGRDIDGFNKIDKGLYQTPNFSESAKSQVSLILMLRFRV